MDHRNPGPARDRPGSGETLTVPAVLKPCVPNAALAEKPHPGGM